MPCELERATSSCTCPSSELVGGRDTTVFLPTLSWCLAQIQRPKHICAMNKETGHGASWLIRYLQTQGWGLAGSQSNSSGVGEGERPG